VYITLPHTFNIIIINLMIFDFKEKHNNVYPTKLKQVGNLSKIEVFLDDAEVS
jgi:hypothetical protein